MTVSINLQKHKQNTNSKTCASNNRKYHGMSRTNVDISLSKLNFYAAVERTQVFHISTFPYFREKCPLPLHTQEVSDILEHFIKIFYSRSFTFQVLQRLLNNQLTKDKIFVGHDTHTAISLPARCLRYCRRHKIDSKQFLCELHLTSEERLSLMFIIQITKICFAVSPSKQSKVIKFISRFSFEQFCVE